ncbi:MAG TPA: DUF5049 domain-containing protein [Patescibacteria group bacterium]|nr:DUF5049 domain-containing protein [Patescibacteria group bacterium]
METTEVKVPKAILEGIMAVRDSGLVNMLDLPNVTKVAGRLGNREAVKWLKDTANRPAYSTGIFHGFTAEESK